MAWFSCAEDPGLAGKEPLPDAPQPEGQLPIAFASVTADQESVTRAKATTLGKDFIVFGNKYAGGSKQTVFDGYTVRYLAGSAHTSQDNTHSYYYVFDDQTLKYWDFAASEYHFWGVWRATSDRATFAGDELTIHDVPLRVGEPAPEDDVLFSSLVVRYPVSTDVVLFRFKRPYAQLRIQFYTSEPLKDADVINLTGITFAPDPEATGPQVRVVYGKGDVIVTYPGSIDGCAGNGNETVKVAHLSSPQDALPFKGIQLTASAGTSSNNAVTAPIDDSDGFQLGDMPGSPLKAPATRAGEQPGRKYYYYPLPMGELNPAFILKVSVDDEVKTAVVPAAYMHWKPNHCYTYIFKITEAGKKMDFYDVKIDPWLYGGSQKEEWKNW